MDDLGPEKLAVIAVPGVVYDVDLSWSPAQFDVEIAAGGPYAVFVEHGPSELTTSVATAAGDAVEPVLEEEVDNHDDEISDDGGKGATSRQWGNAIAASFLVSLCR